MKCVFCNKENDSWRSILLVIDKTNWINDTNNNNKAAKPAKIDGEDIISAFTVCPACREERKLADVFEGLKLKL